MFRKIFEFLESNSRLIISSVCGDVSLTCACFVQYRATYLTRENPFMCAFIIQLGPNGQTRLCDQGRRWFEGDVVPRNASFKFAGDPT